MSRLGIQPTPNPNSLKFTLEGEEFIEGGMESFNSAEEAADHPLGKVLFEMEGVTNVFILPNFLTVTKHPGVSWDELVPKIEEALTEFYSF